MSTPVKTRVVKPTVNCMARWTQAEIDYLSDNAGKMSPKDISKNLGRSTFAVTTKASYLGISLAYTAKRVDAQTLDNILADMPNYPTKKALAEAYGIRPGSLYEILYRRVRKAGRK